MKTFFAATSIGFGILGAGFSYSQHNYNAMWWAIAATFWTFAYWLETKGQMGSVDNFLSQFGASPEAPGSHEALDDLVEPRVENRAGR